MDEQRHFDTWTLTIRNCFSIFSTVCLWALAVRHTRKFCQFVIRQLIFVFCFFFVVSISLFSFLPQWQRKPKCSVNIRIATKIIACHNYLIIYYWFCLCKIKKNEGKKRRCANLKQYETALVARALVYCCVCATRSVKYANGTASRAHTQYTNAVCMLKKAPGQVHTMYVYLNKHRC